jgi:hypothetical protein
MIADRYNAREIAGFTTKRALLRSALNWEAEDSFAREGNCQSDLGFSSIRIGIQG